MRMAGESFDDFHEFLNKVLEQKARTVVHTNVATILGHTNLITSNEIST